MKLLLLLSLVGLAMGQAIYQKPAEINDVAREEVPLQEVQPAEEGLVDDKKVNKRSYGWNPWWPSYGLGHGYGHGWGGHGYGHGWGGHGYGWPIYSWPSYPWWYGGHGWHSHGWHKW